MKDDRAGNVAGEDTGAASASPERSERTGRELELAAKSLRARESQPAPGESANPSPEEGDVDRGA
jgi:hypothetical protein